MTKNRGEQGRPAAVFLAFGACLRDESGGTLVEYALLLIGFVAAVTLGFRYVGDSLAHSGEATKTMLDTRPSSF